MLTFSTKAIYGSLWIIFFIFSQHLSAQVIISQYYEGSVNDKFLEITNISGTPINQENSIFYICLFSNQHAGNPEGKKPGLATKIEAELDPGETIIYKNSLATNPAYAVNEAIGALVGAFNGNDLIVISTTKDETAWENRTDMIGNSGDWGIDKSFYRKTTVNTSNPDYLPDEWIEISLAEVAVALENEVERLGFHFYNCQKPTAASANISFANVSDTALDILWDPGDGSSRLVVIKANEAVSSIPIDGISYVANTMFGSGDSFDGGFVVYNGWKHSCSITNLAPSTTYFIYIYEFDCSSPLYLTDFFTTANQTTLDPVPRIFTTLEESGLELGLVKPGNSSQGAEIIVSWVNLSSSVVAKVNVPFEISTDNINWYDELVIPFIENGNETLYIRFSPTKPDGIYLKSLTLSTPGANQINRTIQGTAFPNAWINEFHYDDIGADEGEFVEVVIQYSENYDLSALTLQLYNGNSGQVYQQQSMDNFLPGEKANNFMVYLWRVANIQNGQPDGPDGLAIGINGELIQFLSYEGIFTPTEGLASGKLSTNLNVEESDDTVEGLSLQLVEDDLISANIHALANNYGDFEWSLGLESPGLLNNSQVLPVDLTDFKVIQKNDSAILSWQTFKEVNNFGFEIQKSTNQNTFETIGFVPGQGTTGEIHLYRFTDKKFFQSCYYRLKQIDINGEFNLSRVISSKKLKSDLDQFLISPNPVRQNLYISKLNSKKIRSISIQLLSIQGKKILQSKGDLVKIRNQINNCLRTLQRGAYVLEFKNGWHSEKHILLKE